VVAFRQGSFERVQSAEGRDRLVGQGFAEDRAVSSPRGITEEEHRGRRRELLAVLEHKHQDLVESRRDLRLSNS
jgi:hypothetical protein